MYTYTFKHRVISGEYISVKADDLSHAESILFKGDDAISYKYWKFVKTNAY